MQFARDVYSNQRVFRQPEGSNSERITIQSRGSATASCSRESCAQDRRETGLEESTPPVASQYIVGSSALEMLVPWRTVGARSKNIRLQFAVNYICTNTLARRRPTEGEGNEKRRGETQRRNKCVDGGNVGYRGVLR